jgi:hypothetical protein
VLKRGRLDFFGEGVFQKLKSRKMKELNRDTGENNETRNNGVGWEGE